MKRTLRERFCRWALDPLICAQTAEINRIHERVRSEMDRFLESERLKSLDFIDMKNMLGNMLYRKTEYEMRLMLMVRLGVMTHAEAFGPTPTGLKICEAEVRYEEKLFDSPYAPFIGPKKDVPFPVPADADAKAFEELDAMQGIPAVMTLHDPEPDPLYRALESHETLTEVDQIWQPQAGIWGPIGKLAGIDVMHAIKLGVNLTHLRRRN